MDSRRVSVDSRRVTCDRRCVTFDTIRFCSDNGALGELTNLRDRWRDELRPDVLLRERLLVHQAHHNLIWR